MGIELTCAHVVPVRVIRSELLEWAGFNDVDPCGDLELSRALEMGRVGGDEALGAAPDTSQPGRISFEPLIVYTHLMSRTPGMMVEYYLER